MGLNVQHNVPKTSELKKLQLKHAVTVDMKKVSVALDAFQKASEKETFLGVMPSLNRLLDALKKWKSDNGKKHPKFVKAMDNSLDKPLKSLLNDVTANAKMPGTINDWRKEGLKRCNEAAKILTGSLDASKISDARKAMEKIGVPLNGIATSANSITKIGDKSAVWKNLFDGAGKAKQLQQDLDKVLNMFEKNNIDKVAPAQQQLLIKQLAKIVKAIDPLKAPTG